MGQRKVQNCPLALTLAPGQASGSFSEGISGGDLVGEHWRLDLVCKWEDPGPAEVHSSTVCMRQRWGGVPSQSSLPLRPTHREAGSASLALLWGSSRKHVELPVAQFPMHCEVGLVRLQGWNVRHKGTQPKPLSLTVLLQVKWEKHFCQL